MTDNTKIKTGTTCIGLIFKNGVMLAADNRVTSYKIVDESFTKIFDLSKNVIGTVSGGVADAQRFVRAIQSELKLISLKNERSVYVNEAVMTLTNYQYSTMRQSGGVVGMLVAGYDNKNGATLHELSPEGSVIMNRDFVTSGSGSIFVDGILTTEYTNKLSEKDALILIEKCFSAAFKNDNASGGGFIVKVVDESGIKEVARKVVESKIVNR